MTTITELIESAHQNACDKGFWDDFRMLTSRCDGPDDEAAVAVKNMAVAQKLALISTEVDEFETEVYQRRPEAMLEEVADIVIRVFDLAGFLGIVFHEDILNERVYAISTASGFASATYRELARCVQMHRKGKRDLYEYLSQIVGFAQDFVCANYSDAYALRRTVIEKMQKNQTRECKHGALY